MPSRQESFTRTFLVLLVGTSAALLLRVSDAWVASPAAPRKVKAASPSTTIQTAKFFKTTEAVLAEDAALAAAQAVASQTAVPSTATTQTTTTATTTTTTTLSEIRELPWMREDGPDADESRNVFLDHWNWQLSFFEEHLTDLRVRNIEEHHAEDDDAVRELYYATKAKANANADEKDAPKQRVYTISLESDEYRDIRMTYMHCPDLQTFRCLSYPRNGDIPVMGMGMMKMGGARNLAIMDYQPLPPSDETESKINDAYTAALLQLRQDIPSMSSPITHKNFAKTEYFTEFPLLGRCNDAEASETERDDYRSTVRNAQRKYVSKHTELTRAYGKPSEPSKLSPDYVLERHSDFDTNVSDKEPAGQFLSSIFGPEKGGRIFHNVIFPLSKHGRYGATTTTMAADGTD